MPETIRWSDFTLFRNSDNIDGVATVSNRSNSKAYFTLECAPHITWWKGLKVVAQDGRTLGSTDTQDFNHGPNCFTIEIAEIIRTEARIVLSAARFLGIHTDMYEIGWGEIKPFLLRAHGFEAKFYWAGDGTARPPIFEDPYFPPPEPGPEPETNP